MCYIFISSPCFKNNLICFSEIHKIQTAKTRYIGEIITNKRESSLLKLPMDGEHGRVNEVIINVTARCRARKKSSQEDRFINCLTNELYT